MEKSPQAQLANPQKKSAAKTSLWIRTPLALAIATTLVAPAFAAEKQEKTNVEKTPSEISSEIESIEVIGTRPIREAASVKFTRPILDTAQTINVIPQELIAERGATTLRDVLRNVSGISMQAGEGGTPAGDQMSIRGYSSRTDIFVDNVRDFGGYTRDPFNLEQVEVVKGPSSDYSGRGSTGGSINLVSKAPTLEDRTSSSVVLGTDNFKRVTVDTNQAIADDSALRLNMLYHDQDIAGRDEITNKRWAVAPSIAFGLDSPTRVTLSAFYLKQENMPDYGIPWVPTDTNDALDIVPELASYENEAPPVDFSNWYGLTARDFEDTETKLATVEVNHQLNANSSFSNLTRYGVTDRDSMITAPRFDNIYTTTDIKRTDRKYRDQKDDIISNQTNYRLDINPGGAWEHKILVGAEFSVENEKQYQQAPTGTDSPPTDLYNPNPNDPYLENYQRTGLASTADSTSAAFYLSDSVKINEHWQVSGGVRWDKFDLEYTPAGGAEESREDKMFSYRAGLIYKPVDEGSIYFGYGTSFNPSTETLSINERTEDLDPEESSTIELGTKWELAGGKLFFSGAIFKTVKDNARTSEPGGTVDILEGEQEVEGLELGLAGQLTESVSVSAGYTYMDTEIEESANDSEEGLALSNAPKNSFSLWTTYRPVDRMQLGFGAQFIDDRYSNTNSVTRRVAPAYWVYETSASYDISSNIRVQLNVQNLTNEEYIDYVGGGHFIPGMGRLALLTTDFTF